MKVISGPRYFKMFFLERNPTSVFSVELTLDLRNGRYRTRWEVALIAELT